MSEDLLARLNRDFGDFNRRRPALDIDALMRDFMFERFRAFLPATPKGRAIAIGLQNAREIALAARHYENQLILNGSGPALERLAIDRPAYPFDLAFGSPEKLAEHGSFDAAFSIHTLNFIERPHIVLKEAGDILNKNGRIFLAVQNATSGTRRMALSMKLIGDLYEIPTAARQWGQLRFLDLEKLRELVRQAGFRALDSGGIMLRAETDAQLLALFSHGQIGEPYLRALFELGCHHPELCASVYVVAEKA